MDAKKVKTKGHSKLPQHLAENCNFWPAYVTYISPVVKKLIEKSKARELECMKALEESQVTSRPSKPLSTTQLKRRKWTKSSGNFLKDMKSEGMSAAWDTVSGPTIIQDTMHFQSDARDNSMANYNKIIFSRKPMARMLPFSSLLASKEQPAPKLM
ncbi:PREDICTED: CMT1A duplicated region transcript 4 protein [Condylura cristata]|uniref:CMT1A duplicated region transcript 4 protein n=1 Tax=Condylura cristata TaxID=143302 RepID=UPI000642F484|nr:PREDICTED: CMT1A duplicated region transcript 4 protein [Condylura cristata]